MNSSKGLWLGGIAAVALLGAVGFAASQSGVFSEKVSVAIDADDIGGVVRNPGGDPEAGVWVIAETRDLGTRYIKIVVTDDQGRYVLPDLPKAKYQVWSRGYGLVDSDKAESAPGATLNIESKPAPSEAAAAEYYPAIYWYSMLHIPAADQFGGAGGIPARTTREVYLARIRNIGCIGCHQLGQKSTRTFQPVFDGVPTEEKWLRRVQSGQGGQPMITQISGILGMPAITEFAAWTDRIAAGALPQSKPPRPTGVERNVVITLRDWMDDKHYLHDAISTDKRNPTVNGYGKLFGQAEYSADIIPILDPVKNTTSQFQVPVEPGTEEALGPPHSAAKEPLLPSPYWGMEKIWTSKSNIHNAMFDGNGLLWNSAQFRNPPNSAFCKAGSDHPSAKLFPLEESHRRLSVLDPKTMKYTYVDTCFGLHHLQFGFDENDTLWTSGGGPVLGWVNTKKFLETGDAAASQGWTAFILDTNGNGKRDAYVETDQPVDPTKDKRIESGGGFYAVMPNPADGSVWGTVGVFGGVPGLMRVDPGSNPPETAISEFYRLPKEGMGLRGADIDKKGVVWVSASSGHLASFDRSKCKAKLNGPEALGDHCPEGWTFYQYPGPGFAGIGENSAEASYYSWVDQHNILGLGEDVPMSTANLNDGIVALVDGKWVMLRVPYPLGFYSKGFDGRIDDPKGGWKARGLWVANGDRTPWLIEGGKGTKPLLAHIQLRPDPLAK